MLDDIYMGIYSVWHGQPQSGKTTFLLELRDYLNCIEPNNYAALYINLKRKAPYVYKDQEAGMAAIVSELDSACLSTFGISFDALNQTKEISPLCRLKVALTVVSQELYKKGRKFILFIDNIDTVGGQLLPSVLAYMLLFKNINYYVAKFVQGTQNAGVGSSQNLSFWLDL